MAMSQARRSCVVPWYSSTGVPPSTPVGVVPDRWSPFTSIVGIAAGL